MMTIHPYPDAVQCRRARRRPPAEAGEVERLMVDAAAHDDNAWSALVRRFGPGMRRVAESHGLNHGDAEDVEQIAWLGLFVHIGRVREPARVGAWLHTTAKRESIRTIVATRRERFLDDDFDTPSVDADAHARVEADERTTALAEAVDSLPAHQRELMQLFLREPQPSYADIAAELDVPLGYIGPTRARSLANLRRDESLLAAIA